MSDRKISQDPADIEVFPQEAEAFAANFHVVAPNEYVDYTNIQTAEPVDFINYWELRDHYPKGLDRSRAARIRRGIKLAIKFTASIALITSVGYGTIGEVMYGDPLVIPKTIADTYFDNTCEPAASWAVTTVNSAIDTTTADENMESLRDTLMRDEAANNVAYEQGDNDALANQTLYQAETYGFHLVDYRPYAQLIDDALSPEEVLNYLEDFTRHYGIDIKFANSNNSTEAYKKLDGEAIQLDNFKNGAKLLTQAFFPIPKELITYSGVKEIRITQQVEDGKYAAEDMSDSKGRPINIDIQNFYAGDPTIYRHELYHAIDDQECGTNGSVKDPAYRALNPKVFKYSKNQKAFQGITIEQYGATAIIEDKATMAQQIIGQLSRQQLNDPSLVIEDKSRLILARLEQRLPGITDYLLKISPAITDQQRKVKVFGVKP